MPVGTPTVVLNNGSGTDTTSYTTASFTPPASASLILFVSNGAATGLEVIPTIGGTLGLTWTQLESHINLNDGLRGTMWFASTTSTPPTGTLSFTFSQTQSSAQWMVISTTGASLSPPTNTISGDFNTTLNPSVNLPTAPASTSCVLGFIVRNSTTITAYTPGPGYTALADSVTASTPAISSAVEYDTASATQAVGWTTSAGSQKILFGVELLSPPAGGVVLMGFGSLAVSGRPSFPAGTIEVRRNLISNPSFEITTAPWFGSDGSPTLARVTSPTGFAGSACLSATATATDYFGVGDRGGDQGIPVPPNTPYAGSMAIRSAAGTAAFQAVIDWYTSAGTWIDVSYGPLGNAVTSGWTQLTVAATSPATAAFVRLRVSSINMVTSGSIFYFDAALLEQASTAGSYFDGDTTDVPSAQYDWLGTAHASASTLSSIGTSPLVLGGSGTLTASGTSGAGSNFTGSVALSGAGALAFVGIAKPVQTLPLTGGGTLAFSGTKPVVSGSTALSGVGQLNFSAGTNYSGFINLSGAGTLTLAGKPAVSGILALAGLGSLSTSAVASMSTTLTLSGAGQLVGTGAGTILSEDHVGTLVLSGAGALALAGMTFGDHHPFRNLHGTLIKVKQPDESWDVLTSI